MATESVTNLHEAEIQRRESRVSETRGRSLGSLGLLPTFARENFMERISCIGKAVGEPYRGKPDVRFDEGNLRTLAWQSY